MIVAVYWYYDDKYLIANLKLSKIRQYNSKLAKISMNIYDVCDACRVEK